MHIFLSRLGILGVILGLTLGSAVPVFASDDSDENKGNSIGAQMALVHADTRVERLLLRVNRREEHRDDVAKAVKTQTGVNLMVNASYGKLISNLHKELNTFGAWLRLQLRDAGTGIAALSLEARAKLYTDILAKIHSALLSLRTDISATISAAVATGSSSSSSSTSSSSSSSSSSSTSSSSSSSVSSSSSSSS